MGTTLLDLRPNSELPEAKDLSYDLFKLVSADVPYDNADITAYAYQMHDRAVNAITIGSSVSSVAFAFPKKVQGKSRDLFLRLVVTGTTPPSVIFIESDGSAVQFDVADDSWADIESGVNILCFTETSQEVSSSLS